MWPILFRCKTLEVMRTRKTLKPGSRANAITYSSCNSNAGERARFSSVAWKSSQKPNSLNLEQSAFAAEWIMQMCTYRTVSMAHERNETFPTDSMRFPSKSLQEQRAHPHTRTHRINSSEGMDSLVARQHLILPTFHSQPVQSGHLSTDVIQLRQRVVQQNPFSQRRQFFTTTLRGKSLCLSSINCYEKGSYATKIWQRITLRLTEGQESSALKRSRRISDGCYCFPGSYIKKKQKTKDKKFQPNLQSWSGGNRSSPPLPQTVFSQKPISSYIK